MTKNFIVLVFMMAVSGSVLGQGWRIAPTFGMNVSYISYSSAFRDNLNSSLLSTKTGALVRSQVGALIDYAFSDRFSVRSGLLFTGKGGSLRFSLSQYGVTETIPGSYRFDYLDIPVQLNFAVGHNDWRVIVGGVAGVTLSGKGTVEGRQLTGYGYYGGNTTNLGIGGASNQIQPFDFSTNLGIVKELDVFDRSLEVGLYFQHSLSKWNSSAKTQPELYARNHLVGLRVTYLFELNR